MEQAADQATHEQQRHEYRNQRKAHREHGKADFLSSLQGCIPGRHPVFDKAGNVLHHHNRVIDHEAGGDGQRHEREIIDAVSQQIHPGKGSDQRGGHRHPRHQRGLRAAQKNENHGHHQQDRQPHRDFHVFDRSANGGGGVNGDAELVTSRDGRVERGQRLDDAIGCVDGIRIRQTVDKKHHARLAVGKTGRTSGLFRINHLGYIAQTHYAAITEIGTNHYGRIVFGLGYLIVGGNVGDH